jgi:hypothetical protein
VDDELLVIADTEYQVSHRSALSDLPDVYFKGYRLGDFSHRFEK